MERTSSRRFLVAILLFLGLVAASGCSSVLYVRTPKARTFTDPLYRSVRRFYFWGLAGASDPIYTDEICLGKDVDQISTYYAWDDVLAGVVTLGVYMPRSVGIWCHL